MAQPVAAPQRQQRDEDLLRFVLAGLANTTACAATNPVDVVKTRLQLDNELSSRKDIFRDRYYRGFFRGGAQIVRDEGVRGLYKGLCASMIREASYSSIRMGAYEPVKRALGATDRRYTALWIKVCAGAMSGGVGSIIATPADVVRVRMQADSGAAGPNESGHTRRYSSTSRAFYEIYKVEGMRGLYAGVVPTVLRAAVLTATQIPTYDHTKHALLNRGWMQEGAQLHIVCSMIAGLMTALTTSPVDVIKTRLMNQKRTGRDAGLTYASTFNAVQKTLQSEGMLAFYKGFIPNWMRLGPHTIITFFVFEQLRKRAGMAPI